ncbi:hypothetical protein TWF569_011861 [Orbilia oligospora]|uniref:Uncharacterized protein n=1 Tax=Orbilia oligospora TaxID=2813651 RepID=A0A7C8PPA1_ORBOL|nr:hypothetical protein TWF102_011723 [Orbilia oligospora]KAF3088056.1 hypothetical protein TWF103_001245 [Orbilia oligospora]KAF3113000.1 hypothetical protein TWF706_010009 [Orbilia oligospora]KAF3127046.1 hypothetical protein TWF569_011861 [Orbilia oligospora]KAF3129308.1 hypothetical protein TWF594_011064 [Orbilia oligospora]
MKLGPKTPLASNKRELLRPDGTDVDGITPHVRSKASCIYSTAPRETRPVWVFGLRRGRNIQFSSESRTRKSQQISCTDASVYEHQLCGWVLVWALVRVCGEVA